MGCTTATLQTGSARVGAIALYLQFGFEPFIDGDADRAAWRRLYDAAKGGAPGVGTAMDQHHTQQVLCTHARTCARMHTCSSRT